MQNTIYDFKVVNISGEEQSLELYRGKVLLIVNVASKCGFTGQYKDLEELYLGYKDRGLVILGFPCNQFGSQEPGDNDEIKKFCSLNYDVTFPMYSKVEVNGENAHPLYQFLKEQAPGILGSKAIKWNFTKFLVDQNGTPIARFAPTDKPQALIPPIKKLLKI
jgi:glutathione peroxidase